MGTPSLGTLRKSAFLNLYILGAVIQQQRMMMKNTKISTFDFVKWNYKYKELFHKSYVYILHCFL